MTPFNRRCLLTGTVAAMAVGLEACGPSPETTQSASAPASAEQPKEFTVEASPTPEPSPAPSPSPSSNASPEALKPNTSHNHAAAEYAYPSEKVQA